MSVCSNPRQIYFNNIWMPYISLYKDSSRMWIPLVPDLPEWAAFGLFYLKSNMFWSRIQQSFTLRIYLYFFIENAYADKKVL